MAEVRKLSPAAVAPAPVQPLSLFYYIKIVEPAAESAGGILLPETARSADTEGEVLAAGPGLDLGCGKHSVMQADVGERVLFQRHRFFELQDGCGFVSDIDLVAIHGEDGEVWPLNDWVKIVRDERETESAGGIVYADGVGKRPRRGVLDDWGNGKLRLSGKMRGTRDGCPVLKQWRWDSSTTPLTQPTVYWDKNATAVTVSGADGTRFALVKAEDLIALEDAGGDPDKNESGG